MFADIVTCSTWHWNISDKSSVAAEEMVT